ncbi:MAG: recombination protein RecR [Candidatus Pacebacteria bacterium]|nr:recombination protein RecR [Candidatus Paceibacterota bacterium]
MKIARPLRKLIESFEALPGIGPKTASRLAFYLLHVPQSYLDVFASNLENLKKQTKTCTICFNVAEEDPCPICLDRDRDKSVICVVEEPLDILALEKTGHYQGVYHVLHGAISPLDNIGPEELFIKPLFNRLKNGGVKELILATNPNMAGEATAMYIANLIRKSKGRELKIKSLKLTRIGLGLPTGADLEYADEVTLTRAIEGRRELD